MNLILFTTLNLAFASSDSSVSIKNKVGVDYRQMIVFTPKFLVSEHGAIHESQTLSDSRFRINYAHGKDSFKVNLETDITFGEITGNINSDNGILQLHPNRIGPKSSSFVDIASLFTIRNAHLKGKLGPVAVISGIKTQHWGLGLISNDGNQSQPFGSSHYGDRVFRIGISTRPLEKVTVSAAIDRVIDDDMATWREDQNAIQAIFASVYAPNEEDRIGLFSVYRAQTESDNERRTNGFLIDFHGRKQIKTDKNTNRLEAEAACLIGNTSRFSNLNNPDTLSLFGCGAAVEIESVWHNDQLGVQFRAVYGDGDSNPDDGTLNQFTIDRDYNMGVLLFDHHRSALELGTENLLSDPEFSGYPPEGVEAIKTHGALKSVFAMQPSVSMKPSKKWSKQTNLKAKATIGLLSAWSTAPIAHAFYTYRNGGNSRNHLNQDTKQRLLGHEINWRLELGTVTKMARLIPSLSIIGSHAILSEDNGDEQLNMYSLISNIQF